MLIFIINCVLFRKAKVSDYKKNADTVGWVNADTIANGSHVSSDGRVLVQVNSSTTQTVVKRQGQVMK